MKRFSHKCKLCRASGEKLVLKADRCTTKCPIDKKGAIPPGQHGIKRRRKISDYGIRLKEKQKLKKIFYLTEKQMKSYFSDAKKIQGATGETMLQGIETRLDNLVFRLGFAPSRRLSKQLIGHKHIMIDGKVVNIPSYHVKPGQIINLSDKAVKIPLIKKTLENKEFKIPSWLERKAAVGKLVCVPKRADMDLNINEQLIVEHYSK